MKRYILFNTETEEWGHDEDMSAAVAASINKCNAEDGNPRRWLPYRAYQEYMAQTDCLPA